MTRPGQRLLLPLRLIQRGSSRGGRSDTRSVSTGVGVGLAALMAVVLTAGPAAAENPVLDAAGDDDLAAALAEAQDVQGVCYGYVLSVSDSDTGQFSGTFASSSAGTGQAASTATDCPNGTVELTARIDYTSSFSEAEDSAGWQLLSTVDGDLSIADVEAVTGASAQDLLDDGRSETALLNAVLSLPGLATERAGLPPVVLEENTEALPEGARATDTPGSDWLRQNGTLLALSVAAVVAGLVALLASRRPTGPGRPPGAPRTFGPPRTYAGPPHPEPPHPEPPHPDPRSQP